MPDITMCQNKECPQKEKCLRFMAKPSAKQAFCNFPHKDCDYFLEIHNGLNFKEGANESSN